MNLRDFREVTSELCQGFAHALRQPLTLIALSALALALGRFTVPGRDLMGWEGWYEFLAHCWVCSMLWVTALRWKEPEGNFALCLLVALTSFETVMFLSR